MADVPTAPAEIAPVDGGGEDMVAGSGIPVEALVDTSSGPGVVNYYFPVTVEVRATAVELDTDALVEQTLDRLVQGLDGS